MKCPCAVGEHTSNAAIRRWFDDGGGGQVGIAVLAGKEDGDKVVGHRRIAYQVPEEGSTWCARSFEDALILANPERFDLPEEEEGDRGAQAWETAQELSKSETALRFAIKERDWRVPRYLRDSLAWLSEPPPPPEAPPAVASASEDEVVDPIGSIDGEGALGMAIVGHAAAAVPASGDGARRGRRKAGGR